MQIILKWQGESRCLDIVGGGGTAGEEERRGGGQGGRDHGRDCQDVSVVTHVLTFTDLHTWSTCPLLCARETLVMLFSHCEPKQASLQTKYTPSCHCSTSESRTLETNRAPVVVIVPLLSVSPVTCVWGPRDHSASCPCSWMFLHDDLLDSTS